MIYHIVDYDYYFNQKLDEYFSENFQSDGFIHCSLISQINKVITTFFKGTKLNLIVLEIDETLLKSKLKYEDIYNSNELFPHIYGSINKISIANIIKLKKDNIGNYFFEI
ncbi:MAG: DUF952 domain-containing protein [Chlorobiota bacterium]|jgi:uncharacterized protein (DUF952 family)|nr:DUF952 domain-containing protein [Chlorobiota bacterium]QQS65562.1 MAG: DUF952 domain-containing protein [Chlorobiota bacterium]